MLQCASWCDSSSKVTYHHLEGVHQLKSCTPPEQSLLNIFKELSNDIEGFKVPNHGYLVGWAMQGKCEGDRCIDEWAKSLILLAVVWSVSHGYN